MANVAALEEQRARLEENVEKLRKSLQHWQTWDAEYEGLKEDLYALEDEVEIVSELQSFANYMSKSSFR